jgi:hypothetical protein
MDASELREADVISVPIPKFALCCGDLVCETSESKGRWQITVSGVAWFRSPHDEFAGCNDAGF